MFKFIGSGILVLASSLSGAVENFQSPEENLQYAHLSQNDSLKFWDLLEVEVHHGECSDSKVFSVGGSEVILSCERSTIPGQEYHVACYAQVENPILKDGVYRKFVNGDSSLNLFGALVTTPQFDTDGSARQFESVDGKFSIQCWKKLDELQNLHQGCLIEISQ